MKAWCEQCGKLFEENDMIDYRGVFYCKECNEAIEVYDNER